MIHKNTGFANSINSKKPLVISYSKQYNVKLINENKDMEAWMKNPSVKTKL
jgi:hypothetical protein